MAQGRISTQADSLSLNPGASRGVFARFQRLLRKIELANEHALSSRLAERWPEDELDEDMRHEFDFETTLYALVKAQKLSGPQNQPSKVDEYSNAFPLPGVLDRADTPRFAGANILHLGAVVGKCKTRLPVYSYQ